MEILHYIIIAIIVIAVLYLAYRLYKLYKSLTKIGMLDLRSQGLTEMPAVPVIKLETLETIVKLGLRNEEMKMAKSGLSNKYVFNGQEQTAYRLMYDDETVSKEKEEREVLRKMVKSLSQDALLKVGNLNKHENKVSSAKANASPKFTNQFLEHPSQFTMSWTNYYNIYDEAVKKGLDKKYPKILEDKKEATEQFWPMIAENGLAYNLLFIQKVNDTSVDDFKKVFSSQWDSLLAPIFADDLLYAIDLRIFSNWEAQKSHKHDRWTPGSLILLQQDKTTKKLTPVAVYVTGPDESKAQTYIESDAAWIWALTAARTSVTVYGIWLGHVYHWHVVTAAMQMTLFKNVDKDHDLRKFLDPMSQSLIGFNDTLFRLWKQIGPPTSFTTTEQFLQLTNTFATGREFFEDDPKVAIQNLGIDPKDFTISKDWDLYPIVGDLLSIWKTCENLVDVFVDTTYKSDVDVYNDKQLQKWMSESANPEQGNIRGLPIVSDRKELKRVLTSLVYRVTAHGNSRLMRSLGHGLSFVANYPPCMQNAEIVKPTTGLSKAELLAYLPNTGTIGEMMTFYYIFIFSAPYEPLLPLFGNQTNLPFSDPKDPRNLAIELYRKEIGEFIETYDTEAPLIHQWPASIET